MTERCPETQNGVQCDLEAGHALPHWTANPPHRTAAPLPILTVAGHRVPEQVVLILGVAAVGVTFAYVGVLAFGLPVALVVGIALGEWIWLAVWAVLCVIALVALRMGWVIRFWD